jgi:hypothetical protein
MELGLNHRQVAQVSVRLALAVIIVATWIGMPPVGLAQDDPVSETNTLGPVQAPIGHRQPRLQELPPDVQRDEGIVQRSPRHYGLATPAPAPETRPDAGDRRVDDMPRGDDLQICRQC